MIIFDSLLFFQFMNICISKLLFNISSYASFDYLNICINFQINKVIAMVNS